MFLHSERRRKRLEQVFGVDVDAEALQAARDSLARMSCRGPRTSGCETVECIDPQRIALFTDRLTATLRCGDALLDADSVPDSTPPVAPPVAWNRAFPAVFQRQNPGFDVVLGNPPYVNIRVLTRSRGPAVKRFFQQRYRSASGSYDLYVLFMERAFQLLREGGRCGMIVPNKIAALDYARNCRTLLLEQTSLLEVVDAAGLDLFREAAVYPYIVIWEKKLASAQHRVSLIRTDYDGQQLRVTRRLLVPQGEFSAETGFRIDAPLALETRVPCIPLGKYAELHSGTTGFVAHELGRWLVEPAASVGDSRRVRAIWLRSRLSSAAISTVTAFGRYPCAIPGAVFCSRSCADCPLLTPRKRQLFSSHKIVVAGMCRRLEAAWDDGGRALGVQVFAAVHPADSWYLLGLLNSKLLSYLFRTRFEAKRLGSGFLSVNKGQLAHLPVRLIQPASAGERRQHDMIVDRVGDVLALQSRPTMAAGPDTDELAARLQQLEQQIDELIYRLYRLTKPEIQLVENSVPPCTHLAPRDA